MTVATPVQDQWVRIDRMLVLHWGVSKYLFQPELMDN